MCQNKPKITKFLAKYRDKYFFICDKYFFIWVFLQLFYNFAQKKTFITKKKYLSAQINIFFLPKWPLLWSPKKGQKQRNQVSRFLGTDGNMKKTPKCNDIPRENWVKSPLSKYAYYRRFCSITGWISHFCKKTPISRINLKKRKISRSKIYPNMILDLPYYISKNVKKKSTFILKLNPACNGSLISIISDATESTFRKELYCMVISKSK